MVDPLPYRSDSARGPDETVAPWWGCVGTKYGNSVTPRSARIAGISPDKVSKPMANGLVINQPVGF